MDENWRIRMKQKLTIDILIKEAKTFCEWESQYDNPDLFGITDGKAVGTFIEHKFQNYLSSKYTYIIGSSASCIDMPSEDINTDVKVTSVKQLNLPTPPEQGYLTISNVLQWRLQYGRIVELSDNVVWNNFYNQKSMKIIII